MSRDSDVFEQVVRSILHDLRQQLGYARVEGKRKHQGLRSRRAVEVDATAYRMDDDKVVVECRQRRRSITAEQMGAFYYIVQDTGAAGGLMVSSAGFQRGAIQVADAERIGMATLNHDATRTDYVLEVADQLFRGLSVSDHFHLTEQATVRRWCDAASPQT